MSDLVLRAVKTVPTAGFPLDVLLRLAGAARQAADGLRRLGMADFELDL